VVSRLDEVGPIPEPVFAHVSGGVDTVFQHPAIKAVVGLFKTPKTNSRALQLQPGYRYSVMDSGQPPHPPGSLLLEQQALLTQPLAKL
jgi:hypothetical protein